MSALERLPQAARIDVLDALVGADDPNLTTRAVVVDTLADKVAILGRFSILDREWYEHHVPALGPAWVIRWDCLTVWTSDPGEVTYAARVRAEHIAARRFLADLVATTVEDLGLGPAWRASARRRKAALRHAAMVMPVINTPPAAYIKGIVS